MWRLYRRETGGMVQPTAIDQEQGRDETRPSDNHDWGVVDNNNAFTNNFIVGS
jgi:hypothetical protein